MKKKIDLLEVYLLNKRNANCALERYSGSYPERTLPHRTYFANLVRKYLMYILYKNANLSLVSLREIETNRDEWLPRRLKKK